MNAPIIPIDTPASPGHYVELTAKLLDQASRTHGHLLSGRQGKNQGPPMMGLWPGGLHSHRYVETCIALAGQSRIWHGQEPIVLNPGEFCVIAPNALHCEGWVHAKERYAMAWLTIVNDSCNFLASTYDGQNEWHVEKRVTLCGPSVGAFNKAAEHTLSNPGEVPEIQLYARMLLLVTELLQASRDGGSDVGYRRLVGQIRQYLDDHYHEPIQVGSLVPVFRMTANYLNSLFSREMGMGIHRYLTVKRMQEAHKRLGVPGSRVSDVAYEVGFADPLYFSKVYKRHFGVSPSGRTRPDKHRATG